MNAKSPTSNAAAKIARRAATLALCFASAPIALCGPIHDATRRGDEAKVVALLKENPDLVASRDKLGNTPLHIAALHDQPAIAALLIANGADINAQNYPQGIDVSRITRISKDAHGETPLTLALLSYNHKEMLELLLTHGADPNGSDPHGTPLQLAIERNLPYDVELLLANGADPDVTAVIWAIVHGKTQILELLLDSGADPNQKDGAGHTPLYYAQNAYRSYYGETSSNEKAIAILKAHGAHL
ncbi:MAG: ankyrin repeat domain-containing protein [Terracidiphilus sp.]